MQKALARLAPYFYVALRVIAGLAFTPDGGRLIIASATGVIEVWGR